jgi:hypothetical protein
MITGYNTDVRHDNLVFHVQTEDKGTSNPYIESLIYVGGQVVSAKRAGYAELLEEGKGEKDILALMEHQHRLMIAAIRGGRFDEKVQELLGQPETAKTAVQEAEQDQALVVAPESGERTLDQVILEYLTTEAQQEHLLLALKEDAQLAMGQRTDVAVLTSSSKSGLPVAGAQVTVKMISTVGKPSTLAVGETDERGRVELALDIPGLSQGTAALIFTAASSIGRAEIKYLL